MIHSKSTYKGLNQTNCFESKLAEANRKLEIKHFETKCLLNICLQKRSRRNAKSEAVLHSWSFTVKIAAEQLAIFIKRPQSHINGCNFGQS